MPSGNIETEFVINEIDMAKTTNLVKIAHKENFFWLYQIMESNWVFWQLFEFSVDQSHISAYLGRIVWVWEDQEHTANAKVLSDQEVFLFFHFAVHG
jgi:hypothetical protein